MQTIPRNKALEILDTPWLRRQVENHLVFGPLSRGGIVAWSLVLLTVIVIKLLVEGVPNITATNLVLYSNIIYASIVIYIFYKMPTYHRAAALWCVIKFTLFILTFIMLVAGGLVGFFSGKPDAIHITVLALIWVPGIEFLARFSEKQKIITAIKILVSIPIVFFWYKTGTWH